MWNFVLKTQFYSDIASPKVRKLRNTFIEEMIPYVNSGLDLVMIRKFILRLLQSGLGNIETDNFYEVPAILRILFPSYKMLVEADLKPKTFFMENCLKGLPHGVILKPFECFKICEIPAVRTLKFVSSACRRKNLHTFS